MYVKKEIYDFDTLYDNSWSGAVDTLDTIRENEKEEVAYGSIEPVTRYKYITTLLLN